MAGQIQYWGSGNGGPVTAAVTKPSGADIVSTMHGIAGKMKGQFFVEQRIGHQAMAAGSLTVGSVCSRFSDQLDPPQADDVQDFLSLGH